MSNEFEIESSLNELTKNKIEFANINQKLNECKQSITSAVQDYLSKNIDSIKFSDNDWKLIHDSWGKFFLELETDDSDGLTLKDPFLKKIQQLWENESINDNLLYISDNIEFKIGYPVTIEFNNIEDVMPFIKKYNLRLIKRSITEMDEFLESFKQEKSRYLKMERAYKALNLENLENKRKML